MVTYTSMKTYTDDGALLNRIEGHCLSTDTKPTNGIANGSCLIEMDTKKVYFFDEEGSVWIAFT